MPNPYPKPPPNVRPENFDVDRDMPFCASDELPFPVTPRDLSEPPMSNRGARWSGERLEQELFDLMMYNLHMG